MADRASGQRSIQRGARQETRYRSHLRHHRAVLGGQLKDMCTRVEMFTCDDVRKVVRAHAIATRPTVILTIWDYDIERTDEWGLRVLLVPELVYDDQVAFSYRERTVTLPNVRVIGTDVGVPVAKITEIIQRQHQENDRSSQRRPRHNSTLEDTRTYHNGKSEYVTDSNTWCTVAGGALLRDLHEAGHRVMILVFSTDYSIPPCAPCGTPMITFSISHKHQTIFAHQLRYSPVYNDILYTIRLAFDDTSYLLVDSRRPPKSIRLFRHDDDEEIAIHDMLSDANMLANKFITEATGWSDAKLWHFLEYLASYCQNGEEITLRQNDEFQDLKMARAKAIGTLPRPRGAVAGNSVQEAVKQIGGQLAEMQTHPTRLHRELRTVILQHLWATAGSAPMCPILPIMDNSIIVDGCYLWWSTARPLHELYSFIRVNNIDLAIPCMHGGWTTVVHHRILTNGLFDEWPRTVAAHIARALAVPFNPMAAHEWSRHLRSMLYKLQQVTAMRLTEAPQVNLCFNPTSSTPTAYACHDQVSVNAIHPHDELEHTIVPHDAFLMTLN